MPGDRKIIVRTLGTREEKFYGELRENNGPIEGQARQGQRIGESVAHFGKP
jgi:hypothetical protein